MTTELREHRPTEDDILRTWGMQRYDETLAKVLRKTQERPTPRPRWSTQPLVTGRRALLVGVAAAGAIAFTQLGPNPTTPPAQALDQLVESAKRSTPVTVLPGTYAHMIVTKDQRDGPGGRRVSTLESWTASDGRIWRHDVVNGQHSYYLFPADENRSPLNTNPSSLAALPKTKEAMQQILERNVSGSTSKNEAIFVAVGDLTRSGVVPPAQRAALVAVGGSLPQVTTTQARGRTLLTFRDNATRPGMEQTLVYDTSTSALVEERSSSSSDSLSFVAKTVVANTARSIPQDVLNRAEPQ